MFLSKNDTKDNLVAQKHIKAIHNFLDEHPSNFFKLDELKELITLQVKYYIHTDKKDLNIYVGIRKLILSYMSLLTPADFYGLFPCVKLSSEEFPETEQLGEKVESFLSQYNNTELRLLRIKERSIFIRRLKPRGIEWVLEYIVEPIKKFLNQFQTSFTLGQCEEAYQEGIRCLIENGKITKIEKE